MRKIILLTSLLLLFASCKKTCNYYFFPSYGPIDQKEIHYDESFWVNVDVDKNGMGLPYDNIIVEVRDESIATYSQTSTHTIFGVSIGETSYKLGHRECDNFMEIPFKVIPYQNIFEAPLIREYGATKEQIKSLESREYIRENGDTLVYNDTKYNFEIKYYFEANKLKRCYAQLKYTYDNWPEGLGVRTYFKERGCKIFYEGHSVMEHFEDTRNRDYIYYVRNNDDYPNMIFTLVFQKEKPF